MQVENLPQEGGGGDPKAPGSLMVPLSGGRARESTCFSQGNLGGGGVCSANLHFLGCSSRLLLNSREIFASRPMPK